MVVSGAQVADDECLAAGIAASEAEAAGEDSAGGAAVSAPTGAGVPIVVVALLHQAHLRVFAYHQIVLHFVHLV